MTTDLCFNCGQATQPTAQACAHCGAALQATTPVRAAAGWGGLETAARPAGSPGGSPAGPAGHGRSGSGQSQVMARVRPTPDPPPAGYAMVDGGTAAPMAHTGWGMVDDPLADHDGDQPSLELASVPPPGRSPTPKTRRGSDPDNEAGAAEAAPPRKPTREERRRQRVFEIAGYGPRPTSLLHVVPYFVRVFMRRRVVAEELAELSLQRKRVEGKLRDAQCEVGQALYLRRADPSLAALARHAAIVSDAESQVDVRQAQSQDARRDATDLMQQIHRRLEAAEQAAAPVEKRVEQLEAKLATLSDRVTAAQKTVRTCEQRIAKLQAKKVPEPEDVDSLQALQAERADAHGQVQSTQLLMHPLREELHKVTARVTKHRETITGIEAERDRQTTIMERQQARHARQAGDARQALSSALQSLAHAAMGQGMVHTVAREVDAVQKLDKDLARKRERETVQREALASYDEISYRKGLFILVGGTALLFLTTLVLIVR